MLGGVSRAVRVLYLASLALLPWSWWPPFPWLHAHAQWGDLVFAAAVAAWLAERARARMRPRLGLAHAAMALYIAGAALSLVLAAPDRRAGAWKLLGLCELCALAIVTADLAARPGMMRAIGRVLAASALATAGAAALGVGLFYAGVPTRLCGSYGSELIPGAYARAQAGLYHPNLLASFCIFAAAVLARTDTELPPWLRRTCQLALGATVLLAVARGILPFFVATAVRAASTPRRRALAALAAAACAALLLGLSVRTIAVDPSHPLSVRLRPGLAPRGHTITSSMRTLFAHPLTGSGLGTHPGALGPVPHDAHLTPLNVAATMGVPALVGFLALPLLLWRGRRRPTDRATWSGLLALGLDALAQDIEDFRHLWVLFGLADQGTSRISSSAGPSGRSSRSSP